MTSKDIDKFRKEVADPVQTRIMDNITLTEGALLITELDLQYLDGRSCGVDQMFTAKGLMCQDGGVVNWECSEQDVSFAEFMAEIPDSAFSMDGKVRIVDELKELEITTTIRAVADCSCLIPDVEQLRYVKSTDSSDVHLKMEYIRANS